MGVIDELLAQYGYLTVAVGIGAESMGAPLPGETILIAAGAYAGATHHLAPSLVVIVAAVAAIAGDNVGYLLGRRYGARILGGANRRLQGWARHLQAVQRMFDRYGSWVVVGGRFLSVVRTYAAFGAGATNMRWRRFLTLNTLGGIGWAALIGFGSAALGAQAGTTVTYALVALAAVGATGLALVVRARRKRTGTRAARTDALLLSPGAAGTLTAPPSPVAAGHAIRHSRSTDPS